MKMKLMVAGAVLLSVGMAWGKAVLFDDGWEFALKDFDISWAKSGVSPTPVDNMNNNGTGTVRADKSKDWRHVRLPHDWVVAEPFYKVLGTRYGMGYKAVGPAFPDHNIGWYRKTFPVAADVEGKRVYLRFDGVCRDAQFWVNGVYLGRNDSAFIGRRFDVTPLLSYGSTNNTVMVRVNASEPEGWWYEGAGIYRHVWLETVAPQGVKPGSVYIRLKELKGTTATMRVDYETCGGGARDAGDVKGFDFTVENARLWSCEDPYLYTLELEGEKYRYGIRETRFDADKGFFLNGKRVFVAGVCCHQDHAGVGTAVPDALWDYRVRRLKSIGVNALRTSHNPPAPELLDACDRLGMMVLDETRAFSASDEGLSQLERLIRRDRNHPCIIAWSIGNEEHNVQNTAIGRQMAKAMKALVRQLDPTRAVTYCGNNGTHYEGANEVADVRGINYVRLMGKEGCDLDKYHADHPHQPVWGSEEASTFATRGAETSWKGKYQVLRDADEKHNAYHSWTKTAEDWTTIFAARPWLAGGFAWTGFDYRGECRWPATVNNFGILDLCGFYKNNAWYYKARWSTEDVLHVYPNWNLPRTNVWVNTNCDEVELLVNGKSQGRQKRGEGIYRLNFPVRYEAGKLEARGWRGGHAVTRVLETTGRMAALSLEADRTSLAADGRDATVINITAVDAAGREVPDASARVYFTVKGPGVILGVGNGDPLSHEEDVCGIEGGWQRKLFNGKCQVVIGAETTPGTFKLTAESDNGVMKTVAIQIK